MQLIDAINSYTDGDARYVLFKVIEGCKSKESALMQTSRRHEAGTLNKEEELKPSYIDTIRSRALRDIRKKINFAEHRLERLLRIEACCELRTAPLRHDEMDDIIAALSAHLSPPVAYPQGNPFLKELKSLSSQMRAAPSGIES